MYRKIRMFLLLLIFCVVGNYASVRSEIVSVAEPVSTEPILIQERGRTFRGRYRFDCAGNNG